MSMSELIDEIMYYIDLYNSTTKTFSVDVARAIDEAVIFKRKGMYQKALEIYLRIIKTEQVAHTGVLNGLFKVLACAGYMKQAKKILHIGNIAIKYDNKISNPFNLPNNFEDHYNKLDAAIKNEQILLLYLKSISGNQNYKMPKKYKDMVSDYMN